MKKGSKIRLAFAKGSNRVIETKNMASGATKGHERVKKKMMKMTGHR